MRLTTLVIAASGAALTTAQSFAGLPTCAQSCLNTGLPKECQSLDIGCICKQSGWIDTLSCCVSKACNSADQASTIQFAKNLCKTVDVTISQNNAGCTAGASGVSGASAMASMTSGTSSSTSVSKAAAPTDSYKWEAGAAALAALLAL